MSANQDLLTRALIALDGLATFCTDAVAEYPLSRGDREEMGEHLGEAWEVLNDSGMKEDPS